MWKSRGQAYADEVLDRIPREWRLQSVPSIEDQPSVTGTFMHQYLTPDEIEITECSAVEIVQRTTTGVWTAVEVAKAFCHRAAISHQLLNCLHEIFFDLALQDAEQTDLYFAKYKRPIGPLHGLPVSLKDQCHVKGVETHMGYVGWIGTFQGGAATGKEKVFESELVKSLRRLGATIYCKTSLAQAVMAGDTANNIIGKTTNPRNRRLHPGASSGGEGALIAAFGSPLGIGTDLGGSIRIPAALNGLFGIRPSSGRLPYEGMANSMDGQNSVMSVVGPLARTCEDLRLMVQSLLTTEPWLYDPLVHEVPWRHIEEAALLDSAKRMKLSFGVQYHDGVCTPHPPVLRALETTVRCLENRGHPVISWDPRPTGPQLTALAYRAWTLDGGADIRRNLALSDEDAVPSALVQADTKQPQATASDVMALNVAIRDARKSYMEYWNATSHLTGTGRPVDAILCPVMPYAAARHGEYKYLDYTSFVNVLDYTSVVVPVTTVDKNIDHKVGAQFRPLSSMDRETQAGYDPELFHGAAIGIQLVGRRLQEEKMLALANYVSEILESWTVPAKHQ